MARVVRRTKLPQWNTVEDAVDLVGQSQNILVLTGAGISTGLGIPDFRSDSGLYARLAEEGYSDPQELFDIENFRENPSTFFTVAKDIVPAVSVNGDLRFSPTHAFVRLIQDKGKLLANYSQNIDGLELAVGIHVEKLVQCHGSLASGTCVTCGMVEGGKDWMATLRSGLVPKCKNCHRLQEEAAHSQKRKRQRSRRPASRYTSADDSSDESDVIEGVLKPDVVFFGEGLPGSYHEHVQRDVHMVDLMIIIGTSLAVPPVRLLPALLPPKVPQIWISKSKCPPDLEMDIELFGKCDVVVEDLAGRLGWTLQVDMIPQGPSGVSVARAVDDRPHQQIVQSRTEAKEPQRAASLVQQ